jgi:hypothetical protein
LKEAPVIKTRDGKPVPAFLIQFSSLYYIPDNKSSASTQNGFISSPVNLVDYSPQPALLDSGNPEILIPLSSVWALARALNIISGQLLRVPCNMGEAKLVFGFNNDLAKIEVPLNMLLLPLAGVTTGNNQCFLPIHGTAGEVSLGAPFLQAAYVVFDAGASKVMLAQAIANVTESNIREYL